MNFAHCQSGARIQFFKLPRGRCRSILQCSCLHTIKYHILHQVWHVCKVWWVFGHVCQKCICFRRTMITPTEAIVPSRCWCSGTKNKIKERERERKQNPNTKALLDEPFKSRIQSVRRKEGRDSGSTQLICLPSAAASPLIINQQTAA